MHRRSSHRFRRGAAGDPRAAATRVVFLKNLLLPVLSYRRALAAVTTPNDAVGEPLMGFLALPNPTPQPAAPDQALAFTVQPLAAGSRVDGKLGGTVVGGRRRRSRGG